MPPGGEPGGIALRLGTRLQLWIERGAGGYAGSESGFVLARDPDTVRGPDVYYVRAEHMPSSGVPQNFWNIAPDLAVEFRPVALLRRLAALLAELAVAFGAQGLLALIAAETTCLTDGHLLAFLSHLNLAFLIIFS